MTLRKGETPIKLDLIRAYMNGAEVPGQRVTVAGIPVDIFPGRLTLEDEGSAFGLHLMGQTEDGFVIRPDGVPVFSVEHPSGFLSKLRVGTRGQVVWSYGQMDNLVRSTPTTRLSLALIRNSAEVTGQRVTVAGIPVDIFPGSVNVKPEKGDFELGLSSVVGSPDNHEIILTSAPVFLVNHPNNNVSQLRVGSKGELTWSYGLPIEEDEKIKISDKQLKGLSLKRKSLFASVSSLEDLEGLSFLDLLIYFRWQAGLSQEEVAGLIHVPRTAIGKIEAGIVKKIPRVFIDDLMNAYDWPENDLRRKTLTRRHAMHERASSSRPK